MSQCSDACHKQATTTTLLDNNNNNTVRQSMCAPCILTILCKRSFVKATCTCTRALNACRTTE